MTGVQTCALPIYRYGQRRGDALTLAAVAAFGGLVGAKLYYLAEHVGDGSGAVS